MRTMLLFDNIFERPCSDLQLSSRYLCIGNVEDFSGKVLVGGLPSPPRYSCILTGMSVARIFSDPRSDFQLCEQ